jgi:hypothetical protein
VLALEVRQQPVDRVQVGRAFHLGQHDAFDIAVDRFHEIPVAKICRRSIDSHVATRLARAVERGGHRAARRRLLGDRHRVLEIHDDGIGTEGKRFLHPARDIAGREKE